MTGTDEVEIRTVRTLEGFDQCVALQLAVWGYSDGDVVPRRMFLLADRIGGQVMAAFRQQTMIGFAMALPGAREASCYLHSHMLAVLPEFRNAGVGRRLKLAQRDDALARGLTHMEWTFDPLEVRNAYLNLDRLGVVVRRYEPNFYGYTSSSLQGGLPTDRLVAEWQMDSDRVRRVLRGERSPEAPVESVSVTGEIAVWKASDTERPRAIREQTRVREALLDAFARGLEIAGFMREADGGGTYLLRRREDV